MCVPLRKDDSVVITSYFYFLLKYMFHAGFVTTHNKDTMKDPPRSVATLGKEES